MKVLPRRTCLGCRQVREKRQLIRLMRLPSGQLLVDGSGRADGRGAYLCPTPACLEAALGRGKLAHALRGSVTVGDNTLAILRTRISGAGIGNRTLNALR